MVVFNYPSDKQPVDKKENYIKRCIAIAGDSIKIVNQQVFINGKPMANPPQMEYRYEVAYRNMRFTEKQYLYYSVNREERYPYSGFAHLGMPDNSGKYEWMNLTPELAG